MLASMRVILIFSPFLLLSVLYSNAQVSELDSTDLIGILDNNCFGCQLEDSNSVFYWDRSMPVSTWYGIEVVNERVYSIHIDGISIEGTLSNLSHCSNLDDLRLMNTNLTGLPPFNSQENLRRLSLVNNQINEIQSLEGLSSLTGLIIVGNPLDTIPELNWSRNLAQLTIQNTNIEYLPSLDSLNNLFVMYVSHNKLKSLPSLKNLTSLCVLYCDNNQLISLPELGNFDDELEELRCYNNKITHLPLSYLSHVSDIECSNNNLSFASIIPFLNSPVHFLYYLPQSDTLFLSSNDTIYSLPEVPFVLSPIHSGGDSTQIQWYYEGQLIQSSNIDTIPQLGTGTYSCQITNPIIPSMTLNSRPVFVVQDDGIRCGDANRDGKVDMQDIVPMGLFYGVTGPSRPDSIRFSGDSIQSSLDWADEYGAPIQYQIGNEWFNMKHADANGDGVIDEGDLDCVISQYTPLQLPGFLKDTVNPGVSLISVPDLTKIRRINEYQVELPFVVRIKDLPKDSVKIKGVVFTEPVAESNYFAVDSMAPSYEGSDLLINQNQLFGFPAYHPNINVELSDSTFYECIEPSAHPMDVGIFNKDSAVYLSEGDQIASCIITIDEIFSVYNPHNIGFDSIPIVLYNYNVLMYVEDENEDLSIIAARCNADSMWINIDSLWANARFTGAVTSLSGDTLTDYQAQFSLANSRFPIPPTPEKTIEQLVNWGDSMTVSVNMGRELAHWSAPDQVDLQLLDNHLKGKSSLKIPEQLIAADMDGNGVLDSLDYIILRTWSNGVIPQNPNQRFWVTSPSDYVFSDSLNPFPIDSTRSYSYFTTREQQDFRAIQLGDLDNNYFNGYYKYSSDEVQDAEKPRLKVQLVPNPVKGRAMVRIGSLEDVDLILELWDRKGELAFSVKDRFAAGVQELIIETGDLPGGLYFLKYWSDLGSGYEKVLIMN